MKLYQRNEKDIFMYKIKFFQSSLMAVGLLTTIFPTPGKSTGELLHTHVSGVSVSSVIISFGQNTKPETLNAFKAGPLPSGRGKVSLSNAERSDYVNCSATLPCAVSASGKLKGGETFHAGTIARERDYQWLEKNALMVEKKGDQVEAKWIPLETE